MGFVLRNQRWRYAKWTDGEELDNLTIDPDERNNLANKPHVAERMQEFRELLAKKQGYPGPTNQIN